MKTDQTKKQEPSSKNGTHEFISRTCLSDLDQTSASHKDAETKDSSNERILRAIEGELAFFRDREDRYKRDTPLITVRRNDLDLLLNLRERQFDYERQRALRYWLWRHGGSRWMQKQKGFDGRAGIAIASTSFDGISYCRCGQKGRFCKMPDFCPRCNFLERAGPALCEYGAVFDKAKYWYALVPSSSGNSRHAGLHIVTRKDARNKPKEYLHYLPYTRKSPVDRRCITSESYEIIEQMAGAPFLFANVLKKIDCIDGAYGTREMDIEFYPCDPGETGLAVSHACLVHGNLLINTSKKITRSSAIEIFRAYEIVCAELEFPFYPDLLISRLNSQSEINRWLSYEVKSLPFDRFYNEALSLGCKVSDLNLEIDQTIFSEIKVAFGNVKSPRKIGNLYSQSSNYIGIKPPPRLTKNEIKRWLQDPAFASKHRDWEETVYAAVDKELRQPHANEKEY